MQAQTKPYVSKQLHRLQIQGVQDIDQAIVDEAGSWLRLAMFTCAGLVATGTALASPTIIYALVPIALAAAVFEVHPVDHVYNHLIRRFTGTHPLPKRGLPTRLACGMGAIMMIATALAFSSGAMMLGYFLGGHLALIAGLAATTDICIPSIMYQLSMGRRDLVKGLFG